MRLNSFFSRGGAYENAVAKLLLNTDIIISICEEVCEKYENENTKWVEKECTKCTPEALCGKHKTFNMLSTTQDCVKVNMDYIEGYSGDFQLYIAKYAIFTPVINNMLLVFDCPALLLSDNKIPNDTWIRKITPFTFGNIDYTKLPKVVQEFNISALLSERVLTVKMNYKNDKNRYKLLQLINKKAAQWHWNITKEKKYEEE